MNLESKVSKAVLIVTGAVVVILAAIWWMNGAERDDAWFYLTAALIAVTGAWSSYPRKK